MEAHNEVISTSVDLIVYDFDGTLELNNAACWEAVKGVARAYEANPCSFEQWREMFRRPLWRPYGELLGKDLSTPEQWRPVNDLYHAEYAKYAHLCHLAPNTHKVLRRVRDHGVIQSILSMGYETEIRNKATTYGIASYMARIDGVKATINGDRKAPYLAAQLAALGVDPRRTVVIGDTVDDAEAAVSVGALPVLVATGITSAQTLRATGHVVTSNLVDAVAHVLVAGESRQPIAAAIHG